VTGEPGSHCLNLARAQRILEPPSFGHRQISAWFVARRSTPASRHRSTLWLSSQARSTLKRGRPLSLRAGLGLTQGVGGPSSNSSAIGCFRRVPSAEWQKLLIPRTLVPHVGGLSALSAVDRLIGPAHLRSAGAASYRWRGRLRPHRFKITFTTVCRSMFGRDCATHPISCKRVTPTTRYPGRPGARDGVGGSQAAALMAAQRRHCFGYIR
jgi:hypothetical protein